MKGQASQVVSTVWVSDSMSPRPVSASFWSLLLGTDTNLFMNE